MNEQRILDLLATFSWSVMNATKKQGESAAANKREDKAAKELLREILQREPTAEEVNRIVPQ